MAISKIITSSLIDDAVTSAKIGTDQVGADALSSSAISGAVDIPANSVGQSELSIDLSAQSVPHIIPGVLQPAIAGKLLNGANHSGAYGTPQTQSGGDGHSYYYTDIKGSKPIKDPRIGAHFGSQRHKTKSLQLLEQETATHGKNIYSVDGREWCRGHLAGTSYGSDFAEVIYYGGTDDFLEIVGYFSDANIQFHNILGRNVRYTLDGVDDSTDYAGGVSQTTPLAGRYVEAGGVENLGLGATLGIHTLKLRQDTSGHANYMVGFELIAQDTSNRNNIQIPSQNVVSYGKKFTVSGTPHYDPFNGFVNGTSLHSDFVDTATSLGLDTAPGSSAKWAISSTNHIRPYQGGRVVKWVDSDGTIKTSVNMMPPNAQNISTTADSETTTPSATNTNYKPAFSDDAIDDSQAEVAKTFHFREFGNGSANGNASYLDVSTATGSSDRAYVMDDGLTSYSGVDANVNTTHGLWVDEDNASAFITFIGTGISWDTGANGKNTWAQNLPYGTHVVQYYAGNQGTTAYYAIDGVQVKSDLANSSGNYVYNWGFGGASGDITFHQPKRPPIPEDACVLADYMLMADFVAIANDGPQYISKGVRLCSTSRDAFFDKDGGASWNVANIDVGGGLGGYNVNTVSQDNDQTYFISEFFGSNAVFRMYDTPNRVGTTQVRTGSGSFTSVTPTKTGSGHGAFAKGLTPTSLGSNATKIFGASGQWFTTVAMEFANPIHTSHHYQTFETLYLHELVGGDRNMEQHNLVVSPDGKTWDEVTRDTSYIGNSVLLTSTQTASTSGSQVQIFDEWRGIVNSENRFAYNKDFAIAYDRLICLKNGQYKIEGQTIRGSATVDHIQIVINGTLALRGYVGTSNHDTVSVSLNAQLKRGDYIQIKGGWYASSSYSNLQISRM